MRQVLNDLLDEVRRTREDAASNPASAAEAEMLTRMLSVLEPWEDEPPARRIPSQLLSCVDGVFQIGDRKLPLSDTEARVLAMMWDAAPNPISRDAIFAALYSRESKPGRGVIDVFVSNLRQKLKLASDGREYIVSIRRKGWALQGERCQRD